MKVIVIGATGTIGRAVADALATSHEVVRASRQGDVKVDIEDPHSIAALFQQVKDVDAVGLLRRQRAVRAAGPALGRRHLLLAQEQAAGPGGADPAGPRYVREGGSVTVTSGVLAQRPMPGGAAISMVNAGLEGFVRGAAAEATRGVRVNVVSPPWVSETLVALKMDPSLGLPAATVARAYVVAVTGRANGETLDPAAFCSPWPSRPRARCGAPAEPSDGLDRASGRRPWTARRSCRCLARAREVTVTPAVSKVKRGRGAHRRGEKGLLDAASSDLAAELRRRSGAARSRTASPAVAEVPDAVDARRHDPQVARSRPSTVAASSGSQSAIENWCETTRVPGSMARMRCRMQRLSWGRRYIRDDGRAAEVLLEDVALDDPGLVGDTLRLHQAAGQLRQVGVVLDADGPGAEGRLRGGDGDPAVAGAQVDHEVLRGHLRHLSPGRVRSKTGT